MAKVVTVTQNESLGTQDDTTKPAAIVPPPGNSPGGIDLRSIHYKAMNVPILAGENGVEIISAKPPEENGPDKDLVQINRLIKAKIIPSGERLRECLRKVPASDQEIYNKQINSFLAEIFMLEEEYGRPGETSFVNLLQKVVLN